MTGAEALATWLLTARPGAGIEDAGATRVLSAVCGTPVTAQIKSRRARPLTASEAGMLAARAGAACHERRGLLVAGPQEVAAQVTAVLIPSRLPAEALARLGIGERGEPAAPAGEVPLGRAVAGLGIYREPLMVSLTPGRRDMRGREQVLCSIARLWYDGPAGLVIERIYRALLDAHPGPWPGCPA